MLECKFFYFLTGISYFINWDILIVKCSPDLEVWSTTDHHKRENIATSTKFPEWIKHLGHGHQTTYSSTSDYRKRENIAAPVTLPEWIKHLRYGHQTTYSIHNVQKLNIIRQGNFDGEKSFNDKVEDIYLNPYCIERQLSEMVTKFPAANITVKVIGRTVEYKDIVLLQIEEKKKRRFRARDDIKYADDTNDKKIVFIVHGLSVMGLHQVPCLSETKKFLELMSYYLSHIDKFDIFLIPLANPDGFQYNNLLWNKNVSPQKACPGVALDRNFDVAWNLTRLINSCSQLYPGPSPFSEAETQAIRNVFHYYHHKIIAYIHVHAGGFDEKSFKGEAVLYPKGYTDAPDDDDWYIDLKGDIEEAMRNASFRVMAVSVDTLHNWYGTVSGTSVDYASTVYSIPNALEFVMQPYQQSIDYDKLRTVITYDSLSAIWRNIINIMFNHIWKSINMVQGQQ